MSESFYAQPPALDQRHVRKKVNEAKTLLRTFRRNYQEAKDENKKELFEKSNIDRTQLTDTVQELERMFNSLSPSDFEPIHKVVSRIKETLETHPIFPPPLLRRGEEEKFPFLNRKQPDTASDVFHLKKTLKNKRRPNSAVASEQNPTQNFPSFPGLRQDALKINRTPI